MQVATGLVDGVGTAVGAPRTVVVVCGVEKMLDSLSDRVVGALATAADAEYEVDQGANFAAINALAMRRYQYEFKVPDDAFAPFSMNAHANAVSRSLAGAPMPRGGGPDLHAS